MIIKENQSTGGRCMNNKEKTRDFEADYYEELHRRFKLEEENEILKKALINVCLRLGESQRE